MLLRKLQGHAHIESTVKEVIVENIPRNYLEVVVCVDATSAPSYDKSA